MSELFSYFIETVRIFSVGMTGGFSGIIDILTSPYHPDLHLLLINASAIMIAIPVAIKYGR